MKQCAGTSSYLAWRHISFFLTQKISQKIFIQKVIHVFDVTISIFLKVKITTLKTNNFFLSNDIAMKF